MEKAQLKGYLLEEAVAYLVRNSGYTLLTRADENEVDLRVRGNTLYACGRGALHQADVLGQLSHTSAFTYPMRLFVEVKCRRETTGISDVRNAVGIINDLNQLAVPLKRDDRVAVQRYSYNYALFSTSGFSPQAVDMAFAHGITLAALTTKRFRRLAQRADEAAEKVLGQVATWIEPSDKDALLVWEVRKHIREQCGLAACEATTGSSVLHQSELDSLKESALGEYIEEIKKTGEVFIGAPVGPSVIFLETADSEKFWAFAEDHPVQDCHMEKREDSEDSNAQVWIIYPEAADAITKPPYKLEFAIPYNVKDLWFWSGYAMPAVQDSSDDHRPLNVVVYRKGSDEECERLARLRIRHPTSGSRG